MAEDRTRHAVMTTIPCVVPEGDPGKDEEEEHKGNENAGNDERKWRRSLLQRLLNLSDVDLLHERRHDRENDERNRGAIPRAVEDRAHRAPWRNENRREPDERASPGRTHTRFGDVHTVMYGKLQA